MKRRSFLKLGGLAGVALVAVPSLGFVSTSMKEAAVGIITKEFSYLKLDKKGVEQFVSDYYGNQNGPLNTQLKLKSYYFLGVQSDRSGLVDDLTRRYIISTDFFLNKMDESKPVNYLGMYDPYTRPCAHPFSSMYYPPVVS